MKTAGGRKTHFSLVLGAFHLGVPEFKPEKLTVIVPVLMSTLTGRFLRMHECRPAVNNVMMPFLMSTSCG